MTPARNWIGGKFVSAPQFHPSFDPATGEKIGSYADGGLDAARQGIAAAGRAFALSAWRHDAHLRSKALHQIADAFERNHRALVELLSRENGKIRADAEFEIGLAAPKLRYFAARALVDGGRAILPEPGSISMILRQPVGVAGILVPWNSPVILAIRSLAPALAAGCTTVLKMPGQSAQVSELMARVIAEAVDLPPGVVNIFAESGREGSAHLVESPEVPVISFTGSSATGRAISATGAAHLKRFGLELGGKTPMIVFDDADLDIALPILARAVTTFAGQFCMTGSRLIVHRAIADQVREGLGARLRSIGVGPASDPASDMGPLIDRANVARVDAIVEAAIAAGAVPIVRGGPVTTGPLAAGSFYAPSFLEVANASMPIVQEESFGPVVTMETFETEAEAVAFANDNQYGLAASVWSRDVDRPLRVAQALDYGSVWVNDWARVFDGAEEGGFKQSGLGRLNGAAAMDDFVEHKHIAMRPGLSTAAA